MPAPVAVIRPPAPNWNTDGVPLLGETVEADVTSVAPTSKVATTSMGSRVPTGMAPGAAPKILRLEALPFGSKEYCNETEAYVISLKTANARKLVVPNLVAVKGIENGG
jgi:hypothetical protein